MGLAWCLQARHWPAAAKKQRRDRRGRASWVSLCNAGGRHSISVTIAGRSEPRAVAQILLCAGGYLGRLLANGGLRTAISARRQARPGRKSKPGTGVQRSSREGPFTFALLKRGGGGHSALARARRRRFYAIRTAQIASHPSAHGQRAFATLRGLGCFQRCLHAPSLLVPGARTETRDGRPPLAGALVESDATNQRALAWAGRRHAESSGGGRVQQGGDTQAMPCVSQTHVEHHQQAALSRLHEFMIHRGRHTDSGPRLPALFRNGSARRLADHTRTCFRLRADAASTLGNTNKVAVAARRKGSRRHRSADGGERTLSAGPLLARTHSLARSLRQAADLSSATLPSKPTAPALLTTITTTPSVRSVHPSFRTRAAALARRRPGVDPPHPLPRALDSPRPSATVKLDPQQQTPPALHYSSSSSGRRPKQPSGRRSTLTSRFPLLRKSSREVAAPVPSIHVRGSSTSCSPPAPADSPFLSTGAPRASYSQPRGRIELASDGSSTREPSIDASLRSGRNGHGHTHTHDLLPDSASTHSTAPLRLSRSATASLHDSSSDDERASARRQAPLTTKIPDRKMHQTSSRLLRMTDDERPFTRDFKDLFSTLMVSLPLSPHRVRFRMIEFTFTSDEAITNLGSLKFSQSNRMPDPKDSSRVVTTTTTTTFSMAKEMARSVCQKFLEAKFIESAEGKLDFQNKGSVWQLTPKGIHILQRFCSRNGIQSAHVKAVIDSNRNPRQLVILERDTETDKLHHDEQTVEIIFRRFVGLNVNEANASDADSLHEFSKCDVGVRMVKHKPTTQRPYEHVFTGRSTVEWLMDCCTMVDRREGIEIGQLFLDLRLVAPVDPRMHGGEVKFMPVKQAQYYVTLHGEQVAGWSILDETNIASDANASKARDGAARDSNSNRTNVIIRNPSWRLLYREFLKDTMCEENLSFYLEVQEFNNQYKAAVDTTGEHKVETIRETLAAAYGLYNAFLAPGSPNELNIDHALRTQLATRMTRAVGDDTAMMQSLHEVALLFEKAQNSIFKLMSSDSVPKFIKHLKYAPQLRGLDAAAATAYAANSSGASHS
ncbi:RGS-domain-containing protein [Amniculicola lignicola CBS 123094]|uniref:RGS-domain-containing protein n=1 Tax=Amniculicola lignicola CBS 123094 TaxID=1392246 RepID=A0A6A5WXT8_9PLEO|nr:RGS-domain-containing protein [Amniculicola lignicola CBS 123094]